MTFYDKAMGVCVLMLVAIGVFVVSMIVHDFIWSH